MYRPSPHPPTPIHKHTGCLYNAYVAPPTAPTPPLPALLCYFKPNSMQGKEKKQSVANSCRALQDQHMARGGLPTPPHTHPCSPSPTPDFRELLIGSRHGRTMRRGGGRVKSSTMMMTALMVMGGGVKRTLMSGGSCPQRQ